MLRDIFLMNRLSLTDLKVRKISAHCSSRLKRRIMQPQWSSILFNCSRVLGSRDEQETRTHGSGYGQPPAYTLCRTLPLLHDSKVELISPIPNHHRECSAVGSESN